MRIVPLLLACLFAALCGALAAAYLLRKPEPARLDAPALLLRVREQSRLETLDASLYKKVDFAPEPQPSDSMWSNIAEWARYAVHAPHGKAIVFAEAHLSIDLRKLGPDGLRIHGREVLVVLPKVETQVELKPGETEIIGSNLDAAETAKLFALAKTDFERQVSADVGLRERAKAVAREDLRALFSQAGFSDITFVDALPPERSSN